MSRTITAPTIHWIEEVTSPSAPAAPKAPRRPRHPQMREFKALFDARFAWLVRILSRTVFAAVAEDAAQEAMIRVWRAMRRKPEQPILDMDAFLVTIAFRAACTLKQRERRHEHKPLNDEFIPGRSRHENLHDLVTDLRSAIKELPEPMREIYRSRIEDGRKVREIRERFDMPLGTVNDYLCRARRIVSAKLNKWGQLKKAKKRRKKSVAG